MLRIKSFTTGGLHPPYLLGEEGGVLPPSVREVSRGESRVTEGVGAESGQEGAESGQEGAESGQEGAESGQEITLAVAVTAATPSDSPSASHLPQEEGLGLRRFASGSGIRGQESGISSFAATSA
jgi:hypothetical protein